MKNFYKAVPNYQSNTQSSSNAATGSSGTSSGTSKGSQQASNQNLNKAVNKAAQTGNTNKVTSQVNQMVQKAMTNKNSATRKNEMKNNASNVMEMLQEAMTESVQERKSNGPKSHSAMAAVKGYMEAARPDKAQNTDMLNAIQESMNEAAFGGNSEFAWANVANKMQEAMGSQLSMTAENASNQVGNQLFDAMTEAMVEQAMAPNIVAMSGDDEWIQSSQVRQNMLDEGTTGSAYGSTIQLLVNYGGDLTNAIEPFFINALSSHGGPSSTPSHDNTLVLEDTTPTVDQRMETYRNETNHSNLLLARISAEADPYWAGGDTTLRLGAYMYDLLSLNTTSYTPKGCAFSYKNEGGWPPATYDGFPVNAERGPNWPQTNTSIYKLDETFNTGMTADEKNYLYHKFGYEDDIADFAKDVIQTKIEAGVKYLAGLVATDELGNQIINNVVDYGDLKTKHLTSISTAERKQTAPTNVTGSTGASWVYLPTP